MVQYIDKADVVAEIERIKKEECPTDFYEGRCKLFWFERFLTFINTLEVKEVDLEKEIKDYSYKTPHLETYFYNDCFELGLKAQKEGEE